MPTGASSDRGSEPWQAQGNVSPMLLEMQEAGRVAAGRKLAPPKGLRAAKRLPAIPGRVLRLANSGIRA